MGAIPGQLAEDVKMCLNATPKLRPNAIQLTKISFFADDPLLKILNYLDSLMQMDNVQKMQFFKGLPTVLEKFPKVCIPKSFCSNTIYLLSIYLRGRCCKRFSPNLPPSSTHPSSSPSFFRRCSL